MSSTITYADMIKREEWLEQRKAAWIKRDLNFLRVRRFNEAIESLESGDRTSALFNMMTLYILDRLARDEVELAEPLMPRLSEVIEEATAAELRVVESCMQSLPAEIQAAIKSRVMSLAVEAGGKPGDDGKDENETGATPESRPARRQSTLGI